MKIPKYNVRDIGKKYGGTEKMYDCIIIGTGPAGLSAALNLKNIQKKVLVWFGSKSIK